MVQVARDVRTGIRDAVRGFNKRLLNPVMLQLAGRPHWYAARLEHVGRRSGRSYATPVVASAVPGGFLVPLPYGQDVDWLCNVQAAQGGVLMVQGLRYTLTEPEVLRSSQIYPDLPHREQRMTKVWRIGYWLRVKATPVEPVGPERLEGPEKGQSL